MRMLPFFCQSAQSAHPYRRAAAHLLCKNLNFMAGHKTKPCTPAQSECSADKVGLFFGYNHRPFKVGALCGGEQL